MAEKLKIDCEEVRSLMGMYFDFDSNVREIIRHFESCTECQKVWRENLRVKEMLKQVVEKENIPQSSIDWIRNRIRH